MSFKNLIQSAAAFVVALLLFSCPDLTKTNSVVEVRVQNLTPYSVFLRDTPNKTTDPLIHLSAVTFLESSIKAFRFLPAITADRLTFYPFFLLPVLTSNHPKVEALVNYYEEYLPNNIYLTIRLTRAKSYQTTIDKSPQELPYQKSYISIVNGGLSSLEVQQGNTILDKAPFYIRGIGSLHKTTIDSNETAVYAFEPRESFSIKLRSVSGGNLEEVEIPKMEAGQIIQVEVDGEGNATVLEPGAIVER